MNFFPGLFSRVLGFLRNMQAALGLRRTPMIFQVEQAECGLICLAMVAGYYGRGVDLTGLRHRYGISQRGATLRTLLHLSLDMGLDADAVQFESQELDELQPPFIAHFQSGHFVVVTTVKKHIIHFNDPALGQRVLSRSEFIKQASGYGLIVRDAIDGRAVTSPAQHFNLLTLLKRPGVLFSIVAFSVVSAIVAQLALLVIPLILRLLFDQSSFDVENLGVNALWIAGPALGFHALFSWFRNHASQSLQSRLSKELHLGVFAHLMRLPLSYFLRRNIDSLFSRLESVSYLKNVVSGTMVSSLLDGVIGIVISLLALYVFGPVAIVLFITIPIYAISSLLSAKPLQYKMREALYSDARLKASLTSLLHGIEAIKNFRAEKSVSKRWHDEFKNAEKSRDAVAMVRIRLESFYAVVFSLDLAIVIIGGAYLLVRGDLTPGAYSGLIFLRMVLSQSMRGFFSRIVELVNIREHLYFLSDILLTPAAQSSAPVAENGVAPPDIVLRDVEFRYSAHTPPVLSEINMDIKSGEFLALIGPSGGGKSTLLKLLLGIEEPSCGQINYVDMPKDTSPRVAAVMQNDQLLPGTILENITLFETEPDLEQARLAARLACIDDDIMSLPMRYDSYVGQVAKAFSGGQVQRILLARALYAQPSILILDEATSHLDPETEARVEENLARLDCTRIAVSHHAQIVNHADRVFKIEGGQLLAWEKRKEFELVSNA